MKKVFKKSEFHAFGHSVNITGQFPWFLWHGTESKFHNNAAYSEAL